MLEIIDFSKSYGNKLAVDNLSFKVEPGDICAFVGHNGAGKTTTIKAIAGILDFDKGDILVDGVSIKEDPISCKKKMAYLPDNPDLYEFLKGIDYLNFICDIYEVDNRKDLTSCFRKPENEWTQEQKDNMFNALKSAFDSLLG